MIKQALLSILLIFSFTVTPAWLQAQQTTEIAPLYEWQRIELSDATMCSNATPYYIYMRQSESPNLMIYFAGGGACWDGDTCSQPITLFNFNGFYIAGVVEIIIPVLDGAFQRNNPDNPFRDWSIVYLPYCTADLHIGNVTNTYPVGVEMLTTVRHNGRQNVTEALDKIFAAYPAPEKLLIAGESAGAWGSLFWTPTIADHYAEVEVYHLGDGAFIPTERWSEFLATWQADLGFEVGDDIISDTYHHYAQTSANRVTYLHDNTLLDGTIIRFTEKMNGLESDGSYNAVWSEAVAASMRGIAESGLDYSYYLTDFGLDAETGTTPHTMFSNSLFYEVSQDGVKYVDWLRRIIIDGERFSVDGAE